MNILPFDKRDYADVIKCKDHYEEIIPDYPGEPVLITDPFNPRGGWQKGRAKSYNA